MGAVKNVAVRKYGFRRFRRTILAARLLCADRVQERFTTREHGSIEGFNL